MAMRFVCLVVGVSLLAACGGGGGWKSSCSADDPCSAGNFCAHTPDGNVCWPDEDVPSVEAVVQSCSQTPCLRDSVLTVRATVRDADYDGWRGELDVRAALSIDPENARPMRSVGGDEWELSVPLAEVPFGHFAADVTATVTVTDEAENAGQPVTSEQVNVTRRKWVVALPGQGGTSFPLMAPAIVNDGGVIVAGSDGTLHFVTTAGAEARAVSIGGVVNGPPVVGAGAIWLARQDGQLSRRSLVNGDAIALANCTAATSLIGPPAILGDRVLAASAGTEILVTTSSGTCNISNPGASVTSPAAVDSDGHVLLATGQHLRKYSVAANSTLTDVWTGLTVSLGGAVSKPLALDAEKGIWTTAASGLVYRTTSAGVSGQVSAAPALGSQGSILLGDGSAVVADEAGTLRRIARSGQELPWTQTVSLTGAPRVPLALRGAVATLLVPTSTGRLYEVSQDTGQILWETSLSTQGLQPANVWTEPDANTSTAYLAGDNGSLHAVIVDGGLDTTAPWPKVFHDPQNTSNAATPF